MPNIKRSPLADAKREETAGRLTRWKPKLGRATPCVQLVRWASSTEVSTDFLVANLGGGIQGGCRGEGRGAGIGPMVWIRACGCWLWWDSARLGGERQAEEHPCIPRVAVCAPRFLPASSPLVFYRWQKDHAVIKSISHLPL